MGSLGSFHPFFSGVMGPYLYSVGAPSWRIQPFLLRNSLPPFAPSLHICQRLRPGVHAGKKQQKSKFFFVALEKWYLRKATMNRPSHKIHCCSKRGPDVGLINLCYHVLVSNSVILLSHDHSPKFGPPKMVREWVGWSWRLGGFWWSWKTTLKMTSQQVTLFLRSV